MPAAGRPIEEIHRVHEAVATMTTHPIMAPVKTGARAFVRPALRCPSMHIQSS